MKRTISELERREAELGHELDAVRKELHEARVEACGVKVGDVVIYKGAEYKVTEIDPSWEKPWLTGNPKKANGTWGIAKRSLFSHWTRSK